MLSQGTVTLKVLERLVDAWIADSNQVNAGTPRKTSARRTADHIAA